MVDFTNRADFLSPNRVYNGAKNVWRGKCPKTFVDDRKTFWRLFECLSFACLDLTRELKDLGSQK